MVYANTNAALFMQSMESHPECKKTKCESKSKHSYTNTLIVPFMCPNYFNMGYPAASLDHLYYMYIVNCNTY